MRTMHMSTVKLIFIFNINIDMLTTISCTLITAHKNLFTIVMDTILLAYAYPPAPQVVDDIVSYNEQGNAMCSLEL